MRRLRPLEDRFWEKVQKSDGCWLWTSTQNGRGYGSFHYGTGGNRKSLKAHRVSYELHYQREVPSTLDVMHSCDNRLCVNPDHLSLGTRGDNMQDAAKKGRVCTIGKSQLTHCCRSHEFTPENTYVTSAGHRKCRECVRAANRKAYIAAAIRRGDNPDAECAALKLSTWRRIRV